MAQHQNLLLTELQCDFLADAIEEGIETAHGLTVENESDSEEYRYAEQRLRALRAVLEQFDPENPILEADFKAGREFDWEAFWAEVEVEEEEDEEEDEEDEPVAAPSPPQATQAG